MPISELSASGSESEPMDVDSTKEWAPPPKKHTAPTPTSRSLAGLGGEGSHMTAAERTGVARLIVECVELRRNNEELRGQLQGCRQENTSLRQRIATSDRTLSAEKEKRRQYKAAATETQNELLVVRGELQSEKESSAEKAAACEQLSEELKAVSEQLAQLDLRCREREVEAKVAEEFELRRVSRLVVENSKALQTDLAELHNRARASGGLRDASTMRPTPQEYEASRRQEAADRRAQAEEVRAAATQTDCLVEVVKALREHGDVALERRQAWGKEIHPGGLETPCPHCHRATHHAGDGPSGVVRSRSPMQPGSAPSQATHDPSLQDIIDGRDIGAPRGASPVPVPQQAAVRVDYSSTVPRRRPESDGHRVHHCGDYMGMYTNKSAADREGFNYGYGFGCECVDCRGTCHSCLLAATGEGSKRPGGDRGHTLNRQQERRSDRRMMSSATSVGNENVNPSSTNFTDIFQTARRMEKQQGEQFGDALRAISVLQEQARSSVRHPL